VADARLPLIRGSYGAQWFVPALYGRPSDVDRLFDADIPLPEPTADLRVRIKALRGEIAAHEQAVGGLGTAYQPGELARRTPGGYAQVTSPLYGVPSNPVFVGRAAELQRVARGLHGEQPVVLRNS